MACVSWIRRQRNHSASSVGQEQACATLPVEIYTGDRECRNCIATCSDLLLLRPQPQPLPAILAALHPLDPAGIVQIPLDRPPQAGLEIVLRLPAQLAADLAGVDGVAAVVAGPVLDVA